jgi:hypothetical protein
VWLNDAADMGIENCIIDGIQDSGGNNNVAAFHMFSVRNSFCRHTVIRNCNGGAYVKFNHSGTGFYGITLELNLLQDLLNYGWKFADPSTDGSTANFIRQNIFDTTTLAINPSYANTNANGPSNLTISNNTAVDCTHMIFMSGMRPAAFASSSIYNNLQQDGGSRFYESEEASTVTSGFFTNGLRENYNVTRGVTNWGRTSSGTSATPAAWNSAFGFDANSQQVAPDQFVNKAAGNFRLNTGVAALTAGNTGGPTGGGSVCPVGAYITGTEEIGLEAAYQ